MLLELHIHDFAIIEDISLEFSEGMTVLTGETGAGKSIIIDAVSLLAGGRGSADFVRHGANKCILEGHFETPKSAQLKQLFEEQAIDYNEEVLSIQREIYQTGRSVCRVNGSLVTISLLKQMAAYLIDIHGQNEHQELMQSDNHLRLLDHFSESEVSELLKDYQKDYQEYVEVRKKLNAWQNREQEMVQKIDILKFQTEEIAEANLSSNEEEELEEEESRLVNYQNITESLTISYQALQEGEHNALELVGFAMDKLEAISEVDQTFGEIHESISNIFYQLQELSREIYYELDNQEYDEDRLNEIASRLNLIQQLKRKYGDSIPKILDFYNESLAELNLIEETSDSESHLTERLGVLEGQLLEKGRKLSKARRKTATHLEATIHKELEALYMDKVEFVVNFAEDIKDLSERSITKYGLDKVEFYISTNPGEPLKELTKIASGGELSRIMLAMKTIFAKAQGITSIIFDEIDTGVSGRVAQAIAEKIHSISKHSQVLCITHLPQVAAIADNHLYVSKKIENERTSTAANILQEEDRVEEIARMLSGAETTEVAKQAASELRRNAAIQK
jgi:DNA repair protein RecN (Recombination protein N)